MTEVVDLFRHILYGAATGTMKDDLLFGQPLFDLSSGHSVVLRQVMDYLAAVCLVVAFHVKYVVGVGRYAATGHGAMCPERRTVFFVFMGGVIF